MPSTVIQTRYDDTFNTEPMHGISCCCIYYKQLLAVRLPLHADGTEKKQAYASEGNLEQTINCIHDAQTLTWGSGFVKGPGFRFLNAGKTLK
jgi:hypothetical protein